MVPRLSSDVRVDILIGMDNADALMPLEVRCSDTQSSVMKTFSPCRMMIARYKICGKAR